MHSLPLLLYWLAPRCRFVPWSPISATTLFFSTLRKSTRLLPSSSSFFFLIVLVRSRLVLRRILRNSKNFGPSSSLSELPRPLLFSTSWWLELKDWKSNISKVTWVVIFSTQMELILALDIRILLSSPTFSVHLFHQSQNIQTGMVGNGYLKPSILESVPSELMNDKWTALGWGEKV